VKWNTLSVAKLYTQKSRKSRNKIFFGDIPTFKVSAYSLSKSKKVLLYDFYVLSYISTLNLNPQSKGYLGEYWGSVDDVVEHIKDAKDTLIPYMKEDLLSAVFDSICCESRHLIHHFHHFYIEDLSKKYPLVEKLREFLENNRFGRSSAPIKIRLWLLKNNVDGEKFVTEMTKIFSLYKFWDSDYGGRKWSKICRGWLRLFQEKTDTGLFIAIDHIFDLEHNSGCVLDKIERFKICGNCDWVEESLTRKHNAQSINELLPYCSSDMKKLALKAIKMSRSYGLHDYQPN